MADVVLEPLPPAEAIAYFRSKGLIESFSFEDVSAEEHAVAFTVAKAMRRDVLQDLREGVDRAIAEGTTFDQFKKDLRPLLEEKGWWGRKAMTDPLTGREREVQLGSSRRLRTIYNTNLRTAYAAGRWERIEATKAVLPFLRYTAVGGKEGDGRTRPQHRAWHGTCLPVDDPFWDTHYPPCDYGCRCTAEQVNQRTMDRRGWSVTEDPPKFPKVAHVNRRSGEVSLVEEGIQPGFDFNPGKARLNGLTPSPSGAPPQLVEVARGGSPAITPRPADLPGPALTLDAARTDFYGQFNLPVGGSRIYQDQGGEPFAVSPKLFPTPKAMPAAVRAVRARGLVLAGQAIRDPDEIRWVWGGQEKPALLRRYIRRADTDEGVIDVVVDASVGGGAPSWSWKTTLDGAFDLEGYRGGVLAWRRLPGDLMDALHGYTGEGHRAMNDWLRYGEGDEAAVRAQIAGLDELLRRRRLTTRREIYRGASLVQVQKLAGQALRPGDELIDPGFMSTATREAVAQRFQADHPDGIMLRIIALPGTPALDISQTSVQGTSEFEILFARGARLKVVSFDRRSRTLTLETIVDPPPGRR